MTRDTIIPTRGMRQSTIGTFTTCAQRGYYYIQGNRPYTSGANRAMGTAYHAGLEWLYLDIQRYGSIGSLDAARYSMKEAAVEAFNAELAKVGEDAFDWQYQAPTARASQIVLTYGEAITMVNGLIDRYMNEGRWWDPDRYVVTAVEHRFSHPSGTPGWNLDGTIDLVLQDRQNPTLGVIVDHKSAKKKWRKGKESHASTPQPGFYVPVAREEFGFEKVDYYFDVMSFEGTFQRIPVPTEPRHEEATRLKAEQVMRLIDNDGPYLPNTDSFLCSPHYCDYWEECPYSTLKEDK